MISILLGTVASTTFEVGNNTPVFNVFGIGTDYIVKLDPNTSTLRLYSIGVDCLVSIPKQNLQIFSLGVDYLVQE